MSFVKRQIKLQFSGDNYYDVSLEGLRATAVVTNPGGNNAYGQLQLRVYGMTLDQMNTYSSTGTNFTAIQNQTIAVSVGEYGKPLTQIFNGTILRSYIDFSSIPEVSFIVSASTGLYQKVKHIDDTSIPNTSNSEDIIKTLTESIGFTFINAESPNNAHCVLQNQIITGSTIDQITYLAKISAFAFSIENNKVYIWKNGGNRDNIVIDVNAKTGMVGYPSYWDAGFVVKQEFHPDVLTGRVINLKSDIPKSNGHWNIISTTYELSSETPNGPWFTTSKLSQGPDVPNN